MKTKILPAKAVLTGLVLAWLCWIPEAACLAQAAAPGLSPDLQEVVRLAQAKMPDDVISNYIANSGKTYRLSADDIIYLNNQGVSAGVIAALQMSAPAAPAPTAPPPEAQAPAPMPTPAPMTAPPTDTAPAPAPVAVAMPATPAPPAVNFQYFHDQLSPFGTWVQVDGVMYWRPDAALAVNPDWRSYYDMGQWVETENGLYWQSDYTWGDIPFHYGRWVLYPGMGWLWAPDYVWGPAWVFWRQDEADGCIGWAPLPVGAVFVEGGFRYHGVIVGADFGFGLGEACFTFVGYDHFHERFVRLHGHEWAWHVDHHRMHEFYGHSVIRNEFHRDDHGRFVNYGIGHDRVDHLTRVEHSRFEERNPVGDRNRFHPEEPRHVEAGANKERPGSLGNNHPGGGGPGPAHPSAAPAPTQGQPANRVYRPPTGSAPPQREGPQRGETQRGESSRERR